MAVRKGHTCYPLPRMLPGLGVLTVEHEDRRQQTPITDKIAAKHSTLDASTARDDPPPNHL